jgi:hypothetical protein
MKDGFNDIVGGSIGGSDIITNEISWSIEMDTTSGAWYVRFVSFD